RECGSSDCCDHGNSAANQVGRQRWQSIGSIIGPAVFDRYVLAIDKARLLHALVECAQLIPSRMKRCGVEEPHDRHRRRLRARREWPCGSRAAEQRDDLAPSLSLPSRAGATRGAVMSRPGASAVLGWPTSSYLVGPAPGGPPGFPPQRMGWA